MRDTVGIMGFATLYMAAASTILRELREELDPFAFFLIEGVGPVQVRLPENKESWSPGVAAAAQRIESEGREVQATMLICSSWYYMLEDGEMWDGTPASEHPERRSQGIAALKPRGGEVRAWTIQYDLDEDEVPVNIGEWEEQDGTVQTRFLEGAP